jgi:exodeoxyribonuclease VII large subunit
VSQPELDLGPASPDSAPDPTFGVGELTDALNATLKRGFPAGVWVRGEISGFRPSGPHIYFSLVEETERGRATLAVSLFAPHLKRLTPLLTRSRLRLDEGLRVRIHGHLDVYAPSGRLSLKMDDIDPRFTLGDLALQRDLVIQALSDEGLLEANRKTVVPAAPMRLGVVTSITSAAWADFRHELERSALGFSVSLCDVRVQGDLAAPMVSRAITMFSHRDDIDVIVVIRGGGARSDLVAFDSETIARAICGSSVPVFTGLGHEIDRAVADEVAHTALKTPTACAVALVELVREHVDACEQAWQSVEERLHIHLQRADARVGAAARGVAGHTIAAVTRSADRLDHRCERLTGCAERHLVSAVDRMSSASIRLARRSPAAITAADRRLDELAMRARFLDPVHVLARGWTITRDEHGAVVRDPFSLAPGAVLTTQFANGTATSRVESTDGTDAAVTDTLVTPPGDAPSSDSATIDLTTKERP